MFWWLGSYAYKKTVTLRLLLRLAVQAKSSAVMSGIPARCPPMNFARNAKGEVFFTDGLMPMMKWNGFRYDAVNVGVTAPVNKPTLSAAGSGTLSGTYQVYQRFVDADDNPSSLSPVSNSLTVSNAAKLAVSNLDLPTETKVTRRQILRNTSGQALTYYVEVDTTDLAATSFNLTMDDVTLGAQEAVPLFDTEGNTLANRFSVPVSNKTVMAAHQGRMFAAGDATYSNGACEVTNGSTSVQGVGTNWTTAMQGRYLYILGEPLSYQVKTVDPIAQTLVLTTAFEGPSDNFALYTIRSAPAEKNLIYFTEAGFYDAWPPTNALEIEENSDEVTGMMPAESFLYIIQRRHTYRLSYLNSPGTDGGIFLANRRGCVNQRCWVQVDGDSYLLDEEGIYKQSGNGADSTSEPIQDLFWLDHSDPTAYRINWDGQCHFHAQHHKEETTIRWYVALSGNDLPRHALCFNYRTEQWWIEEYPYVVGASTSWDGQPPRPLVAGPSAKVLAPGIGTIDGLDPDSGTTRGTVTSSTRTTLSDSSAIFPASNLTGQPVTILDGRGKGQQRIIAGVSGTTLTLTQPWTVQLDSTSDYQIGGIQWRWRGGWYRYLEEEENNPRHIEAIFQPCASPAQMDVRLYKDHAAEPLNWELNWPPTAKESTGVTITKGDPDMVVNLDFNRGYASVRLDGHKVQYTQQGDFVSLELRGVSAENPIRLYQVAFEGVK